MSRAARQAAVVLTASAALAMPAAAQWQAPAGYAFAPPESCPLAVRLYKSCDDQMRMFLDAVARARAERKLLIVVFGADWCPECRSLDELLAGDQVIGRPGLERMAVVHIAVSVLAGQRLVDVWSGLHVLKEIAARAGAREKLKGIPYVAVVDPETADRTALFSTAGTALEGDRKGHDPAKIEAALRQALARLGR
jgi:thiol-disulfide isomerase/thioredoxin